MMSALGAIYCLIATASWGAMFPVMTGALVRIDPFTFTSLRYLIAGAAFLAVLIFKEGWSAVHFKGERMLAAWLLGTAGFAGFNFLMFLGQKMIGKEGALVASIIAATMPMLGLLVNWAVRKNLLNVENYKQSTPRRADAREQAIYIIAQNPKISTRELAREVKVDASTISRWRRNAKFKEQVEQRAKD